MTLWQMYLLFVKIGLFTFGGGYAMIPLFQTELVTNWQFMTNAEFANFVALAQVTPGPVGLNAATYIGYQCGLRNIGGVLGGAFGGLIGTLGVMTPSLVVVTAIAYFMQVFKDNPVVKAILSGIRPATLGLIAAAVVFFAETSVFSTPLSYLWTRGQHFGLCWQGVVIFAATLLLSLKWKISPVWILIGSAIASWLLFQF